MTPIKASVASRLRLCARAFRITPGGGRAFGGMRSQHADTSRHREIVNATTPPRTNGYARPLPCSQRTARIIGSGDAHKPATVACIPPAVLFTTVTLWVPTAAENKPGSYSSMSATMENMLTERQVAMMTASSRRQVLHRIQRQARLEVGGLTRASPNGISASLCGSGCWYCLQTWCLRHNTGVRRAPGCDSCQQHKHSTQAHLRSGQRACDSLGLVGTTLCAPACGAALLRSPRSGGGVRPPGVSLPDAGVERPNPSPPDTREASLASPTDNPAV